MFSLLATVQPEVIQPEGYVYPNELELLWSTLIVVYPYVTGLVAGAFILASLVKVFNVKALKPAYRLALLISLAFLLAAPLPLLFHLGHPERSLQVMITPHLSSPMAIFGFVYAWYLMAVLLLELWLDYRADFVKWSRGGASGIKGLVYKIFTVGVWDVSDEAVQRDSRLARIITIIGIPSAFLLHGYVGFIFGSVKANPWWGTVLMPIIFIFSAMVSGIALCIFVYVILCRIRDIAIDMKCIDAMGSALFYMLIIAGSIEALDWIHRLYEAEESIHMLTTLATGKLFYSLVVIQGGMGIALPFFLLGLTQIFRREIAERPRRVIYFLCSVLILIGVLAMRWNVVIGGQLVSKSLRGFTQFKVDLVSQEGLLVSLGLLLLPFFILWVFIYLFLPDHSIEPAKPEAPAAS